MNNTNPTRPNGTPLAAQQTSAAQKTSAAQQTSAAQSGKVSAARAKHVGNSRQSDTQPTAIEPAVPLNGCRQYSIDDIKQMLYLKHNALVLGGHAIDNNGWVIGHPVFDHPVVKSLRFTLSEIFKQEWSNFVNETPDNDRMLRMHEQQMRQCRPQVTGVEKVEGGEQEEISRNMENQVARVANKALCRLSWIFNAEEFQREVKYLFGSYFGNTDVLELKEDIIDRETGNKVKVTVSVSLYQLWLAADFTDNDEEHPSLVSHRVDGLIGELDESDESDESDELEL